VKKIKSEVGDFIGSPLANSVSEVAVANPEPQVVKKMTPSTRRYHGMAGFVFGLLPRSCPVATKLKTLNVIGPSVPHNMHHQGLPHKRSCASGDSARCQGTWAIGPHDTTAATNQRVVIEREMIVWNFSNKLKVMITLLNTKYLKH